MPDTSRYWYSLIAASPNPENEEAANIALVVGNGKAIQMVFNEALPRLCGLANSTDAAVYRAILRSVAEKVNRGIDASELQALLGPQLRLMRPRGLYRPPSDELLQRLKKQFLERPRGESEEAAARALFRRSTKILSAKLQKAVPFGVEVTERVTPRKLYEHRLDARLGYKVPIVAKAVRFSRMDVLIDSVVVEPGSQGRPLAVAATRVSQAFFAYNTLRPDIERYTNREITLIGVIHRGPADDPTIRQRREWVKHSWGSDAEVFDGNEVEISEALKDRLAELHG